MFKSWLFEVKQEPTRWEYELPSDWRELPELFRYFGSSEVIILIQPKQTKFVLDGNTFFSDNDEFGNPLWVVKEVVGMLNSINLLVEEYVYFYICNEDASSIQITKMSMEEYEAEKPPFCLGKGQWDLYFKDPTDPKVSIGELPPECYLVF